MQQTRRVTPTWITPVLCNSSAPGSVQLPAAFDEVCTAPSCFAGQFLNTATGKCEYCAAGTSSVAGSTSCTACGTGEATEKKREYTTVFNKNSFTTGCTGECRSQGWRFAGNFIDSGLGNGISESFVTFDVSPSATVDNSSVIIDYAMSCIEGALEFYVDGIQYDSISCGGCKNFTTTSYEIELPKGAAKSTIKVNFRTYTVLTRDAYTCDRVLINKIQVVGGVNGGSGACYSCPAGTFTKDSLLCNNCPAGTFSGSKSSNCTDCPVNTFSKDRSYECRACGNGTVTNSTGSPSCNWQYGVCTYDTTIMGIARRFTWQTIHEETNGQAFSAQNERGTTYYFNLCGSTSSICGNASLCKVLKAGEIVPLADSLSVSVLNDITGLQLALSTYQPTCFNNLTNTYQSVSTSVQLKCRATRNAKELPYGPVIYMTGPCSYDIVFYKNELCPLCKEDDFYLYLSECHDNADGSTTQEQRWLRKQGAAYVCTGGIDRGTNVTSVPCSKYVVQAPFWILGVVGVVVLVVVVALVILAVVLYVRYRKLEDQFHKLQDDSNDTETGKQ